MKRSKKLRIILLVSQRNLYLRGKSKLKCQLFGDISYFFPQSNAKSAFLEARMSSKRHRFGGIVAHTRQYLPNNLLT